MATVREIEQEVFAREGVCITISLPQEQQIPHSYARMFPRCLPDDAHLAHLIARVTQVLGDHRFGVVNPLGSPNKISAQTRLSSVRDYYQPKREVKSWWQRQLENLALALGEFDGGWLAR